MSLPTNKKIKVSIITVCYNSSKTIQDTIESVLSQTYTDIEYILIDGCSTDNTLEIIKSYAPRFLKRGIEYKWLSEPDRGLYDAMNKGVRLARGDWIGIINSDDFFYSNNVIANVVNKISLNNIAEALYSDLIYVDEENTSLVRRYWKSGHFNLKRFYYGWMPPHPTLFIKRSIYDLIGSFNLNLGSAADYEFMLRMFVKYRIAAIYLDEITVKMRAGGVSNSSLANRVKANKKDREAWRLNGLDPYWFTLHMKPLRKLRQFKLGKILFRKIIKTRIKN